MCASYATHYTKSAAETWDIETKVSPAIRSSFTSGFYPDEEDGPVNLFRHSPGAKLLYLDIMCFILGSFNNVYIN